MTAEACGDDAEAHHQALSGCRVGIEPANAEIAETRLSGNVPLPGDPTTG